MNPVYTAAADNATLGWLLGGMTVCFLLFFLGWVVWAWLPSNRARLDAAALLPLENTDA